MGAWGTGVFADDVACEVRDAYKELLAERSTRSDATERLLRDWREVFEDPDSGPVGWLALAVTQWKLGRLDSDTQTRVLAIIERGEALMAWSETPGLLKQRQAVFSRVETQLRSPQRLVRAVKKRFRDTCDWEVGELISYRTCSQQLVVFRVCAHHTDRGGTSPIVEVLDWVGMSLPPVQELQNCRVRLGKMWEGFGPLPSQPIAQLFIGRTSERQLPKERIQRLGIQSTPARIGGISGSAFWTDLDKELADIFGIV